MMISNILSALASYLVFLNLSPHHELGDNFVISPGLPYVVQPSRDDAKSTKYIIIFQLTPKVQP